MLCEFGGLLFEALEEVGECFDVLVEGAAVLEFIYCNDKLVEGVGFFVRDGLGGAQLGQVLIGEVAEDVVAFFGEEGGELCGGFAEAVPVLVFDPVVEAAAANAKEVGDLCFGEVCLEEEFFGLLFFFV